jgi:hypothetical protein
MEAGKGGRNIFKDTGARHSTIIITTVIFFGVFWPSQNLFLIYFIIHQEQKTEFANQQQQISISTS